MSNLNNDFIKGLNDEGGEVYVIGGHVRNMLYNKYHSANVKIKDTDYLVRLLDIENIINILSKYGQVKEVGKAFGIILLTPFGQFDQVKESIEIAVPRKEHSTGTKYTDFKVSVDPYLSLKEDCERRDATINALAIRVKSFDDLNNLNNLEIIDHFDGQSDLQNKIWKAIGDPLIRLKEDSTRILRAFRQSAELDLEIEKETFNAIITNYRLMEQLIPESYVRLFNEIFRLLKQNESKKYLQHMANNKITNFLGFNLINSQIDRICTVTNLRIKIAILFEQISYNTEVREFGNLRQIVATNYMERSDLDFCECAYKFIDELFNDQIKEKYNLLKIINKIDTIYNNNGFIFCNDLIDYFSTLDDSCDKEKTHFFKQLFSECIGSDNKYPSSVNQIKLNGRIVMDRWNLKGKDIAILKNKMIDLIYQDKVINEETQMIEYVDKNIKDFF
jgi:tRNA nucleotidyltransferase (CCA-adding enzyme)